jgi:hypothetical protein
MSAFLYRIRGAIPVLVALMWAAFFIATFWPFL